MARLMLLLANVSKFGSEPFNDQIEELRFIGDLSSNERHIIQQIFSVCFQFAEREGRTLQKFVYQRLIRRLLLNQPLDLSIGEARAMERDSEVPLVVPPRSATVAVPTAPAKVPSEAQEPTAPGMEQLDQYALIGAGALILLVLFSLSMYKGDGVRWAQNSQGLRALAGDKDVAQLAEGPLGWSDGPTPAAKRSNGAERAASAPQAETLTKQKPPLKPHTAGRLEPVGDGRDSDLPEPTGAKQEQMIATVHGGIETEIARAGALKQEPRFAADAIEKVDRGARVIVLAKERDWIKVQVQPSGNVGYLRKEYLSVFTTLR